MRRTQEAHEAPPPRPGFRSGTVALIGRPNVGKSTLANRLVGVKVAIVSEVPQTTRRRIRGVVNLPGGQIVLVDTPGIHRPLHEMNRRMVAEATEAMQGVDLILLLVEPPSLGPGDRFILSRLPREGPPVLLVVNKVDRVRKERLLPLIEEVRGLFPFREILLISALTGDNAGDLPTRILSYLPEGPPLFPEDHVTDQQERARAAEIVREKLLHHTRQEIPHETCVLIDRYHHDDEGRLRIEASILVEKESQKKIVIGRDGSMLKSVGTQARSDLERLAGGQVVLKLWVKVRPGWRDDEAILGQLGIAPRA